MTDYHQSPTRLTMRLTVRLIEIFVRVVECGNFVAAARNMLVDPAVVSRAIKSLEEGLGVQLFQRTTRSVKLTADGVRFHRDAEKVLKSFDETLDNFRARTVLQGQLRVGLGPALGRCMLLRAIPSFQQR